MSAASIKKYQFVLAGTAPPPESFVPTLAEHGTTLRVKYLVPTDEDEGSAFFNIVAAYEACIRDGIQVPPRLKGVPRDPATGEDLGALTVSRELVQRRIQGGIDMEEMWTEIRERNGLGVAEALEADNE